MVVTVLFSYVVGETMQTVIYIGFYRSKGALLRAVSRCEKKYGAGNYRQIRTTDTGHDLWFEV